MNRYASKSEVLFNLERGGTVESHDLMWWLVKPDGETARIRYSLWKILESKHLQKPPRREKRPPSRLPFFIYTLRKSSN